MQLCVLLCFTWSWILTVVTSQRPNACVNSSSTGKRPVVEYVGESQDINSLDLATCITVPLCDPYVG